MAGKLPPGKLRLCPEQTGSLPGVKSEFARSKVKKRFLGRFKGISAILKRFEIFQQIEKFLRIPSQETTFLQNGTII